MTANLILHINGYSTAACGLAMLATRGWLYPAFGLQSPAILDAIALGFLAYAAVLVATARRERVGGARLMAFAGIDAAWVALSAAVLLVYWTEWTVVARLLTIATALVVELFATLQFRAATAARRMELAVSSG